VEATWSELAAMELSDSVYAVLRPSLEGDGASFGLMTDLRGDVLRERRALHPQRQECLSAVSTGAATEN
jgi:hypothetical protein